MMARRQVAVIGEVRDDRLRSKIRDVDLTDRCHEAIEEDIHLIEAAMVTDRRVLSIDNEVHACLNGAAVRVGELRTISWVNPNDFHDAAVQWLREGAPRVRRWYLGAGAMS